MENLMTLYHHYIDALPPLFYKEQSPVSVANSSLLVFNDGLGEKLGLGALKKHPDLLGGNVVPEGATPIAQAYSGHQFGYFTRLGDGRAVLLGEVKTPTGEFLDLQLKGSGPTPFSRGGDGRAGRGPMLREYLISEAMAGLGIPTTRSLAVVATGEKVYRETVLDGAVLTRIAKSHIRVGTFQYGKEAGGDAAVRVLADYAIARHYPRIQKETKPYLAFIAAVATTQAKLIAKWMAVGFIHGVMNTDNMSIAGETIDYGPCAFMDTYDPATVFSSIDTRGRYAYGNQPNIAQWNLARFAESLIGVVENAGEGGVPEIEEAVLAFSRAYPLAYREEMAKKLGIFMPEDSDDVLIAELLNAMKTSQRDYTNTFVALTASIPGSNPYGEDPNFGRWYATWKRRLEKEGRSQSEIQTLMENSNPALIPRNHLVEQALSEAVATQDLSLFSALAGIYTTPYDHGDIDERFITPLSKEASRGYRTYCGT